MKNIDISIEPCLGDVWIGLYWKRTPRWSSGHDRLDLYICLLPMLPIHTAWHRRARKLKAQGS